MTQSCLPSIYAQEYGNKNGKFSRMECRKDVMEYIASGGRIVDIERENILPSIIPHGHH